MWFDLSILLAVLNGYINRFIPATMPEGVLLILCIVYPCGPTLERELVLVARNWKGFEIKESGACVRRGGKTKD